MEDVASDPEFISGVIDKATLLSDRGATVTIILNPSDDILSRIQCEANRAFDGRKHESILMCSNKPHKLWKIQDSIEAHLSTIEGVSYFKTPVRVLCDDIPGGQFEKSTIEFRHLTDQVVDREWEVGNIRFGRDGTLEFVDPGRGPLPYVLPFMFPPDMVHRENRNEYTGANPSIQSGSQCELNLFWIPGSPLDGERKPTANAKRPTSLYVGRKMFPCADCISASTADVISDHSITTDIKDMPLRVNSNYYDVVVVILYVDELHTLNKYLFIVEQFLCTGLRVHVNIVVD